jgi:site-specific DNA recombinase
MHMVKAKDKDKKYIKAAVYCRVSTIEQGKADFSSLDAQQEMLRQHCKNKGWDIYKVYTDTKSGKTLERPELVRLLKDAEDKKIDVVLATKLDRLSRSTKDFLELDEILRSQNIDIVITTQHIDTTTPAGQMQRTIMIAFAQFEREMIAERTRESTYVRAQKGYWLGGSVPLGYDVVEKKLRVNEQERDLVRRIFKLYLDNPSTRQLTTLINSEGHKTKIRTTKAGTQSGGNDFNYQSIHNILRNPVYTGWIKMNGEQFKGLHESIIEDSLFELVQKRLDLSAIDTFATLEGSPLLLLGTTKCGFCGGNLTTYFSNNGKNDVKHYYYKCTTTSKQDKKKCPSRLVPARDLEEFTQNLMLHTARKQGFFDAITAQIVDNSEEEVSELNADKTALSGNLSAIDKKISNLTDNFTQGVLDEALKQKLVVKLTEMETEKTRIQHHISELSNKIEEIQQNKFHKTSLKNILREFDAIINNSSIEEKRQMMRTIIEGIKISAKTGEKDGLVEFKIRGNGTLVKKWNEVVKQRGVSLTPRLGMLRIPF